MFSDVTAVSSEVPASIAEDLFASMGKDRNGPVEDQYLEAVIAGAGGSQENEANEQRINNTVFIGKNLEKELEKGFED
jgi:hypothetical protein